jgi:DnaJ-class molecular chaperone
MSTKSLYDTLGVSKSDTCIAIKKAYLKLARIHHPDKGGDAEKFKEITKASDILTDEKKRRIYDETGMTDEQMMERGQGGPGGFPFPGGMPGMPGMPPGGFPFEFNMNDLFGNMFGNPPVGQRGPIRKQKKPNPTVQTIPITLEQFYLGHRFDININRQSFCTGCDHSGAKTKEICRKCNGQGAVTQIVQMGPMAMHTTGPCHDCQGKGERVIEVCGPCFGSGFINDSRKLSVNIVPGTRAEETFHFPEVCSDHPAFERPGDAHIMLQEDPNDPAFKSFKRIGDRFQHLETKVSLSLSESLIGCVVKIENHPGYDEGLFIQIPAGSFQNDTYCIRGVGMPLSGNIGSYGDLFLKIDVTISVMDRSSFTAHAAELLTPHFKDRVRVVECTEDSIQKDAFLQL